MQWNNPDGGQETHDVALLGCGSCAVQWLVDAGKLYLVLSQSGNRLILR